MLVDWFTTAAQILNFLILVWLLKRFLYKPIVRAMDEREKRMVNALNEAEEQKTNAENKRLAFEKKLQELAQEKEQVLKNATEQAEEERKRMISAAREEVTGLEARWREAIDHEKGMLFQNFAAHMQNEIFAVSRQVLSDLAGTDLEECIANRFVEQLKSLEPAEKDRFAASLGSSSSEAVLTSAFELPESGRRQIEAAVEQELGVTAKIRFVTAPEIVGGIELSTNGHKVSWTIQNYLSSLERDMDQVMEKGELQHVQPAS
jgi:F-type H+-transporting ATPase subunit b